MKPINFDIIFRCEDGTSRKTKHTSLIDHLRITKIETNQSWNLFAVQFGSADRFRHILGHWMFSDHYLRFLNEFWPHWKLKPVLSDGSCYKVTSLQNDKRARSIAQTIQMRSKMEKKRRKRKYQVTDISRNHQSWYLKRVSINISNGQYSHPIHWLVINASAHVYSHASLSVARAHFLCITKILTENYQQLKWFIIYSINFFFGFRNFR